MWNRANTQISLSMLSVWSESSLDALYVAKVTMCLHTDSKGFGQTKWMRKLIWVFDGRPCQDFHFAVPLLIWFNLSQMRSGMAQISGKGCISPVLFRASIVIWVNSHFLWIIYDQNIVFPSINFVLQQSHTLLNTARCTLLRVPQGSTRYRKVDTM